MTVEEADTLYVVDADDGTVFRTVPSPEPSTGYAEPGILIVGNYIWMILGNVPADLARIVP